MGVAVFFLLPLGFRAKLGGDPSSLLCVHDTLVGGGGAGQSNALPGTCRRRAWHPQGTAAAAVGPALGIVAEVSTSATTCTVRWPTGSQGNVSNDEGKLAVVRCVPAGLINNPGGCLVL